MLKKKRLKNHIVFIREKYLVIMIVAIQKWNTTEAQFLVFAMGKSEEQKNTEHLSESCIGCPYLFTDDIK